MSKRSFKDTAGREYKIKITIPRLRMVRDEIDVDLGKPEAFLQLATSPIDLVDVLYLLVKGQADKYKLTDVAFGESFDGPAIESAWEALSEAYLSFCPSHRADTLRKLMADAQKAELLGMELVDDILMGQLESFKSDWSSADASESNRKTIPLEN